MNSNNFQVNIRSTEMGCSPTLPELRDGSVKLAFGSEYAIYLHNANSKRAAAKIYIDDELIGDFVVNALDGWVLETSPATKRKFRFVDINSKSAKAAGKYHKEDLSNGVIAVHWRLEQVSHINWNWDYTQPQPWPWEPYPTPWNQPYQCSNNYASNAVVSREGCTVQGSKSNQNFMNTYFNTESQTTVIQLVLRGNGEYTSILSCNDCGAKIKRKYSFCPDCGKVITK